MEANATLNYNKNNYKKVLSEFVKSLLNPRELNLKKESNLFRTDISVRFKSFTFTEQEINLIGLMFALCAFIVIHQFSVIEVNAASMSGVSDIFNSKTFIGDTKWLEKMNWVGKAVNMFITVGGTIAAIIVAVQLMITLIYWGNPNLWDSVNQVKVIDQKKGVLNYTASLFTGGKSAMVGNMSRGSDIVMDYLILIMPNIKKYSENAEDEYENFTTWIMKTFVKKTLLLLALSMMINGSLMQAYMVVVDGLGVAAERFVELDSKAFVAKMLTVGENYQFSVGASGTGVDALQGKVAGAIYREIMKKSESVSGDYKYAVGSNIERYVRSNITKDQVMTYLLGPGANEGELRDEDWTRIKVEVVMNGTPGTSNGLTVSSSDIGLEDTGKPRYLHIYFTLKSRGDSTYYFGLPDTND